MGRIRLGIGAAVLLALTLRAPPAPAQTQVKPYMLLLVDTSSSMIAEMTWAASPGDWVYGDGSNDAPYHADFGNAYPGRDRDDADAIAGNDARLWILKDVLRDVVASTGDVIFGLERYHMQESPLCYGNNDCIACGSLLIVSPLYENNMQGPDSCCLDIFCTDTLDYLSYRGFYSRVGAGPDAGLCTNLDGSGATTDPGGDILVGIADDNQNRVMRWMDHSEQFVHGGGDSGLNWNWVDPAGPEGRDWSKELRASGFTPLARSVDSARTYLEPLYDAEPVVAGQVCRPYSVVVLTDGGDTCERNAQRTTRPVTAVEALCEINGGTSCTPAEEAGGLCSFDDCSIKSYVVAFAVADAGSLAVMQNMADAGSTGYGDFPALDRDTLASAMSDIIADTVLTEVCNGVDDDCDLLVDEGVTNACGGCGPLAEICDSLPAADEDCDGLFNEGFTLFCDRPGAHLAADLCVDPGETVCDGVDDNCNGIIDEGGICGGCVPAPEICDNLDNDCDAIIDEGLLRPCGTDVGECTTGNQICNAGVWGACSGIGPAAEMCDRPGIGGDDDDCDGVIDGMVRACGSDVGECAPGNETCIAGAWGACVGGIGPIGEICDDLDNDCDGVDDDGNPGGGAACGSDVGECAEGIYQCVGGELVCDDVGPAPELCDGLDNDCDALTDEGNPEGGLPCGLEDEGECEDGVFQCLGGDLVCVGGVGPVGEICDGRDNDCDGVIDDGNPGGGAECGTDEGECEPGTLDCIGGELVCVDEVGPTDEICDDLDNDCDGAIDEGIPVGAPCGSDIGECEPGNITCIDGVEDCAGGVGPTGEICDGLDNDCDGSTDEGLELGDPCGVEEGDCEPGALECVAGEIVCAGGAGPVDEVCDCGDNDCDGATDEDNPCPGGSRCIDCSCVLPCAKGEFPCPIGRECIDDWCVGDLCRPDGIPIDCPEGTECRNGVCEDMCAGVVCAAPLVCNEGRCVPNDCYNLGCEDGEACVDGLCVPHPCEGVECLPDEYCREGDCVGLCADVECPAGRRCVDGECETDPCFEVECPGDRICVEGDCVDDPCLGVACPVGRICEAGECVDDPCLVTICPEAYECEEGVCDPEASGDDGGSDGDGGDGGDGEDPWADRTEVLATGRGGCACATTGPAGATSLPVLGLLLGLLFVFGRRRREVVLAGAAVVLAAGCEVDPYCLGDGCDRVLEEDAGGGTEDSGPQDAGADANDGGFVVPDACDPDAEEICNEFDDNCNDEIDEGFDLSSNPLHCGRCGNACRPAHAFPTCEDGVCGMGDCDVGFIDLDGDPKNGCEYSCLPTGVDDSVCDARDNDCDGTVDEDVDLTSDPENCGACGFRCRPLHGAGSCVDSDCEIDSCDDGFWDIDGEYDNGCEYACAFVAADESCNLEDDDCDGETDADDPDGIVDDGGDCGIDTGACAFGTEQCVDGLLECQGGIDPVAELCNDIDDDCDGGAPDEGNPEGGAVCGTDQGECIAGRMNCVGGGLVCQGSTGPVAEACDARDNDCDGTIDDGNPGGGDDCGTDTGECEFGLTRCVAGAYACDGGQGPVVEACNTLDDDCDTLVDETFNLNSDRNNCGACGNVCNIPNAIEACVAGSCEIVACDDGWIDDPLAAGEDCDYACDFAGGEICNGNDDDCDRSIDEGLVPPVNFCNPNGACAGTAASCDGVDGWDCVYPAAVQTDVDGNIIPETRCDAIDNDCDGFVDEAHPLKGTACFNGDGECRRFGLFVCDPDPLDPVVCNAPPAGAPGTELCNGRDDDCDGAADDGITLANSNAVYFDPPGAGLANDFWIFRYEASRPDAVAGDAGTDDSVACSNPDVLPWANVTWIEADAACDALNTDGVTRWQVCNAADWQYTCERGAGWVYPYNVSTYNAATCNGNDFDCSAAAGDQDCLYDTEAFAGCSWDPPGGGANGIYDLSGNLKEWTNTERPAGSNDYEIRGGSYNNIAEGLTCQFDFTLANDGFSFQNLGFRCCNYP